MHSFVNIFYLFLEHEQFLELPGDFGRSELHLFFPKFRQQAQKFAWMTGGITLLILHCVIQVLKQQVAVQHEYM